MHVGVNVCMHACMYFSLKLAHVGALWFFSSTLHVLPIPSDFSNFALPVPMLNRFMLGLIFSFFLLCWVMLALLAAILAHLGALGIIFVAKLVENRAKMLQCSSIWDQFAPKLVAKTSQILEKP